MTAEQHTEATLEEQRPEIGELWRAAFESNPTMYFIVDTEGTIVLVNSFGARELGYSVDELVGRPVSDIFYEHDRAAECFEQPGRTRRWESRKIRKDGTMIWVRETANAILLKNRPVLLIVCEDITEQKRTEEAARRSESDLRDLIENVPAMVFIALPGPSNAFSSRRWREYTGLSGEDKTGSGWRTVVHPHDLKRHMEKWRACSASGAPFEDEARFRRAADGEYRWFLVRAVPLRSASGKILKWYGVLTDTEDRKQAEALLAGEKRILEFVAKGVPLPEILDGLCRLVEQQTSGTLASILSVEGDRLRHGGAPSLPKAYTDAIDGAQIGPCEGSCGTAAYRGEQVVVEDIATDPLWAKYRDLALPHSLRACWSTPVISSQGKVIATFAMYYREPRRPNRRDQKIIEHITDLAGVAIERKLIYDQLQRSESYLAEGQALSHTGSFGWNPATDELYWSAESFRIYEYNPACPIEFARIVQQTHSDDRAFLEQTLDRARHEKKDFEVEYRLLMADGSVKHLQVVARALEGESGDVEFVGSMRDVTQAKRAEEAQRAQELEREAMQRQRQLAAKMEALGQLAGGIAHDFNNLLGSILGYGELVQNEVGEGGAVRRHIDQVMQAGARGKGLVDGILAFSRSGIGERVPLHVQSVVEETLELLSASLPDEMRLEARLDAADTAVVGDATQLHQVTMNLCRNAMQAMAHGGVLSVVLAREAAVQRRVLSHGTLEAGRYVRISIGDTGSGIAPAVLERMFDPFFTTKRVGDGTGLGLALVNGIVADLGGSIDVATEMDVGTTFTIWLPAADEMPAQLTEPASDLPRGNGETVMIVDDERALVALAEETLAQLGYEPVGFDSSLAALHAFCAEPKRFDLVLTDETMPDLMGTELALEIRRLRPDIPIILVSGYGGAQLSERAQAAGVLDVLRKPLIRRDIAEPIARALHAGL
jgi:PAS domain S-box-containing protein